MSGHPTPDIDIGELRRLEKAANAPHDLKAVSMSVITNAEADYFAALRNAAPALLAAAEEGERLRAENARLRTRSREIAEASDRRNAELQSRVAKYEQANERAKKDVDHLCADWAVEPYKSTPGTFWSMTSENNRNALAVIAGRVIGLQSRLAAAEAVVSAMHLILPLAKGYAHAHQVGSNMAYIEEAERALSTYEGKSE